MTGTLKDPPSLFYVMAVVLVTAIGLSLTLRGWRSRVPVFDLLPYIDSAHELITSGRFPDRGTLTSFASYAPPGTTWLMLPGVFFFSDPRLYEYLGSGILYPWTLLGIFLLAHRFFGIGCAVLSVALYGLSDMGIGFAGSLWPRGHAFFYVWMVYWIVQWVTRRNAKYLAAAIVTWALGMYVFMEIAPALFIFPAVWLFYRPSVKPQPVLLAGMLVLAIWYPYLRFEFTRSFVDLKSQVLRQRILPAKYKESWCDPGMILRNLEDTSSTVNFEPDQTLNVTENIWTKTLGRVTSLWGRWNLIGANFERSVDIPGIRVVLAFLFLISLFVLSGFASSTGATEIAGRRIFRYWVTCVASGMILVGVLANEFFIARYLSRHGTLQPSTLSSVRWLQAILIVSGITLLMLRSRIAAIVNVLARSVGVDIRATPGSENARLLVLCLLVPWLILLLLAEDDMVERFRWLWPLQVIALAALVTYIPSRLQAPRLIAWLGPALIVFMVLATPRNLSRVEAWLKTGWSGPDADEVQVVDYVFSHLQGRNQAAIGYQVFIWHFSATYNIVDPRYKAGADFDLLFKDRHGLSNTNRCAEGVSPNDEFRIVQTTHGSTDPGGKGYFEIPLDRSFHLLQQIGPYQVFKRD